MAGSDSKYTKGKVRDAGVGSAGRDTVAAQSGITAKVATAQDNSAARATASNKAQADDFVRQHAEMMKKKREAEKKAREEMAAAASAKKAT